MSGEENMLLFTCSKVGRDGAVCTASRYGLDGLGFKSRWRRDFPPLATPALEPTHPPKQYTLGHSRGQCGRGVALTTYPHIAPRLKEEYSYTSTPLLVLHGLF
jgi:hypothetical protein